MPAAVLAGPDGLVLILSALYGLLTLGAEISPYDLRMGRPGSVTPAMVCVQAARLSLLRHPDVTVLAGRAYADVVSAVWPHARRPLTGNMLRHQALLAAIGRGELDVS